MTAIDDFRAVGAAVLRIGADILNGPPEPCGHDMDVPVGVAEPCACGAGYPNSAQCPWCSPEPALTNGELIALRGLIQERYEQPAKTANFDERVELVAALLPGPSTRAHCPAWEQRLVLVAEVLKAAEVADRRAAGGVS